MIVQGKNEFGFHGSTLVSVSSSGTASRLMFEDVSLLGKTGAALIQLVSNSNAIKEIERHFSEGFECEILSLDDSGKIIKLVVEWQKFPERIYKARLYSIEYFELSVEEKKGSV